MCVKPYIGIYKQGNCKPKRTGTKSKYSRPSLICSKTLTQQNMVSQTQEKYSIFWEKFTNLKLINAKYRISIICTNELVIDFSPYPIAWVHELNYILMCAFMLNNIPCRCILLNLSVCHYTDFNILSYQHEYYKVKRK